MISLLISRLVLLICGTLYPAYASYKTVKTKNVRDYVKWMMYWIVFAGYTFVEIFADIFLSFWFPFYYELKILFVLWLVCPATRGSTYIFRKLVNPHLSKHEVFIDSYIASVWNHGYDLARKIGAQGMDCMVEIMLELVRKGQITFGHFLPQAAGVSQNAATPQITRIANENLSSDLNAEDFVIMTDHSEVDEPQTSKTPKITEVSDDSWSETEEFPVKKIQTRSKKASTVRERKKVAKK